MKLLSCFTAKPTYVVYLLLLCCLPLMATASAEPGIIDDPRTVATVNGFELPVASVDLIYKSVASGPRSVSYKDLVNGLIENRLLSTYAEKEIGSTGLMSHNSVGFPVDVYLDDQFIGVIQSAFHQPLSDYIKTHIGASPDVITTVYLEDKQQALSSLLTMNHKMEYQLTSAEQEKAQSIVLADYKLPKQEIQSITLMDVYHRQNVQGRIKLHQLDQAFINRQISQIVSSAVVNHWVNHYSGLTESDISALKQFIKDKDNKVKVIAYHGVSEDMHGDNLALDKAFKQVTSADIKQYYRANKDKFRRIEYVEARHIRLADSERAQHVMALLDSGVPFSEAAARFSIADTKLAVPAGSLGTVRAEGGESNWAKSAVFALKPGVISRPIRSPQGDGKTVYWEIFLVDNRHESYFDVNSETVRYLAGKDIARRNLQKHFMDVRASLFETATVNVNPALINRPMSAL